MPVENIMLRERSFEPRSKEERFDGAGWTNIQTGTFVRDDDAFYYAITSCVKDVPAGFCKIEWTQEFKEMLVEWFYSGGEWKRED